MISPAAFLHEQGTSGVIPVPPIDALEYHHSPPPTSAAMPFLSNYSDGCTQLKHNTHVRKDHFDMMLGSYCGSEDKVYAFFKEITSDFRILPTDTRKMKHQGNKSLIIRASNAHVAERMITFVKGHALVSYDTSARRELKANLNCLLKNDRTSWTPILLGHRCQQHANDRSHARSNAPPPLSLVNHYLQQLYSNGCQAVDNVPQSLDDATERLLEVGKCLEDFATVQSVPSAASVEQAYKLIGAHYGWDSESVKYSPHEQRSTAALVNQLPSPLSVVVQYHELTFTDIRHHRMAKSGCPILANQHGDLKLSNPKKESHVAPTVSTPEGDQSSSSAPIHGPPIGEVWVHNPYSAKQPFQLAHKSAQEPNAV